MEDELDTVAGGESLSVDQAAAAFVNANAEEADEGQAEVVEQEEGEQPEEELEAEQSEEGETEGEEEPDEEGQSEEVEEGEEPESSQGRFVASDGKVRLPDGTVQTVAELVQGNLRDRDYRQKTMGLADEKRSFEEQSSALKASQQQIEQQREYLTQLVGTIIPQPPDLSMLDENSPDFNPIGYNQQKAQFDTMNQHFQYLQQQGETAKQQAEAEMQKQRQQRVQSEWEALQKAIPDLGNRDKLQVFEKDLQSAAEAYGFTRQELSQILPTDHRMSLALRDAGKWRKLQASKPKAKEKVQGRPPVQRGGKRLTPDAQRARKATDAVKRLKETGSVEDATAAYLASQKG